MEREMLQKSSIRKILKMRRQGKNIATISEDMGHARNTVSKYVKSPLSERIPRNWVTRSSPFEEFKGEIEEMFRVNPTLEALSLLEFFMEKYPGRLNSNHLRSLQRHLKRLRALIGAPKEVMFSQEHKPGELSASDFTNMNNLKVTIGGGEFPHLLYHFVLSYSNWEWGRICFSESLESLRSGLKECLFRLGGVTKEHLTDNLSAAVHNICNPGSFKDRYQEILNSFGIKGRHTQPRCPNENGDIEQRHYRFKRAAEQALLLRGSRNFLTRKDYEAFLHRIFQKLNELRKDKVEEEVQTLRPLPSVLVADYTLESSKVSSCSTIRVKACSYSVPSRLIGEEVEVRIYDDIIEVWYAQKQILTTERLRGENKSRIDYRHLIESLKRKPGAFKGYRYRDSLYPSSIFKLTYEYFLKTAPLQSTKIYLEILDMAAKNGQDRVERVLTHLFQEKEDVSLEEIQQQVLHYEQVRDVKDVNIEMPDLSGYDEIFGLRGIVC